MQNLENRPGLGAGAKLQNGSYIAENIISGDETRISSKYEEEKEIDARISESNRYAKNLTTVQMCKITIYPVR